MRIRIRAAACAVVAAAFVTGLSPMASAQTVDDLLAKYYKARGGLDRLKGLTTIRMAGKLVAGGQEMQMQVLQKRPNLVRQEMTVMNQRVVNAFDGQRAWSINPFMGSSDPQEVPAAQTQAMRNQADFDGPLVDPQAKGHKVDLLGPGTVEGRRTNRLKVTTKAGAAMEVDLDAETGLEVRITRDVEQGGNKMKVETFTSDYRDVSGLLMPFSVRTLINGQPQAQMTIDRIEIGVPIDDAAFKMPAR